MSVRWEGRHDRTEDREVTFVRWERVGEMLHWTPLDHGGSYSLAAMKFSHVDAYRRDETLNRVLTDILLYVGLGRIASCMTAGLID